MPRCCICGTVKNCAQYLNAIFTNMEKIGTLFEDYRIILYYDHSDDATLQKIRDYQRDNKNLELFINQDPPLLYRTHRIAKGRNRCLQRIRNKYNDYGYFIVMDCDDVCSSPIKLDILKKTLFLDDWDSVSFNKKPYYDTWALSIKPLMYSYRHFENAAQACENVKKYIDARLNALSSDDLLPCASAFSGFAVYKTHKFLNCHYDGRLNVNLFSKKLLLENMKAHNMKFVIRDASAEQSIMDDCEHRSFHIQAINKNQARIRISPEVLFS